MNKVLKVMLVITPALALTLGLVMLGCTPSPTLPPGQTDEDKLSTYQLEISLPGEDYGFLVDSEGKLQSEVEVSSADGEISLSIDKGTIVLDVDAKPLQTINAVIDSSPPPAEDAYIVGTAYDLGPEGATFDSWLLLTLSYNPEELPEGVRDADLYVAYYNNTEWCNVGYRKIDTKPYSVTTHLYDFNSTTFAILGPKELAPPSHPTPIQGTRVGNLAPDFQLQNLDGQSISLSGLQGKPVLLNFWATQCPPCRSEMPYLQEIYNEWSDKELTLVAINIGESSAKVERFMQSQNLSLPVLLDTKQDVAQKYGIQYIPTTFFIDKDGIIQEKIIGAFSGKAQIEMGLSKIIP